MECNVCLSYYTTNKPPYVGSCGHSFCLECWVKASQPSYYICPLCKKVMHINSIIKNFLAIDILEKEGTLTLSSLITEYKNFNEEFEERYEQNKKLKDSIIALKKEKKNIIEEYREEAYRDIVQKAYDKSNSILVNTHQFSERMISETEDIVLDMLIGMEDSIKKVRAKLNIYKNIALENSSNEPDL